MTKEQFAESMNQFMGFYDKQLNAIQQKIWFEIFSPFEQKRFNDAIRNHIETNEDTRFPALATIYKATKGWRMG